MTTIGIAGAGAWGLALALTARRAGSAAVVWSRRGAFEAGDLQVTGEDAALSAADILLLVIPAQELDAAAARLSTVIGPSTPLVICAKGIARPGNVLLESVVASRLPGRPVAILSGPTFASEVALGLPAACTIASHDPAAARQVALALRWANFRPYVSGDPVGVQLGGAIKNVIAIACGIVAGRRAGENARAALMTRGLAEIARLGRAMGARGETFSGLAGLGDLSLTATSVSSRNFRFGVALGEGRTAEEARAGISGVVEGAATAAAVVEMAARHGVELPISAGIAAIIERGADIGATIAGLLARPLKSETL